MDLDGLVEGDVQEELLVGVALEEGIVLLEDVVPLVFGALVEALALRLVHVLGHIAL
jgi:hypothetical protein